ncbi:MAG: peroxidase [Bradyrhizobium sp.]|nr:peroxidase [Bradyrhizobium sp.]
MRTIEWPDVQRIVLSGYPCLPRSAYVLWRFRPEERALGKQWLAVIVNKLTPAVGDDPAKPAINLALTHSGLQKLGAADHELNSFSLEFIEGMAPLPVTENQIPRRTNVLGDLEASSPALWDWGGWRERREIDGVLLLYAADDDSLKKLIDTEMEALRRVADGEPIVLKGRYFPDMREHFGYVDGISQPKIEGRPKRKKNQDADEDDSSRIKPGSEIKPGEFLLGYYNERRARIAHGPGRDIRRNGTYLVFRQLEQDVPAFNAFLSQTAKRIGENEEWVAARLLGRSRDGDPLAVTELPAKPGNAKEPDAGAADAKGQDTQAKKPCGKAPAPRNDFLYYYKDRAGLTCPIGAHIRRANPRDSLGPDPETALRLSKMHRILRRGRPYGERWQPDAAEPDDDKTGRGMLFIALNADIAGQFEMIQHSWLNNPRFNGLYSGADPISHFPDGQGITIQNRPANLHIDRPKPFVRVRGGAYFFLPGIQALRDIAARP